MCSQSQCAFGLGPTVSQSVCFGVTAAGNRQGDMLFKYLRQVAAAEGTCASVSQRNGRVLKYCLAMSTVRRDALDKTRLRWAKPEQLERPALPPIRSGPYHIGRLAGVGGSHCVHVQSSATMLGQSDDRPCNRRGIGCVSVWQGRVLRQPTHSVTVDSRCCVAARRRPST